METKNKRESGNNALREYFFASFNVLKAAAGFGNFMDNLKRLGYQPGLTM